MRGVPALTADDQLRVHFCSYPQRRRAHPLAPNRGPLQAACL